MRGWIPVGIAGIAGCAGCGRVGFDAQSIDASSGVDAAAPCSQLPGMLFCESFEAAEQLPIMAGDVTADETRAYRGTRSQHAITTGASEASWQIGGVLPYVLSGDLYARWYVYAPSVVTSMNFASVHLVEETLPFHGIIFGVRDGAAEVSSSEAAVTSTSTIVVPRDRWVCLQMHVVIGDTAGEIDAALDGQPVAAQTGLDTLPTGGFRNVHVGLFSTALATGPIELWTDEVAVGTQPIPCE